MVRVRNEGCTLCFGSLYERHAPEVLGIATAICRDRADAEEVVQESFLAVWRGRDGFRDDPEGSFRLWLRRIVRNKAIDLGRRKGAQSRPKVIESEIDLLAASDGSLPDVVVARAAESESLRSAIGVLPPEQVQVLALAYYGELSGSEIAEYLGVPEGTVKGRMRLGLEKLRWQARSVVA